ncbi:hypothetical protein ACIBCT_35230 [Streptosporangium sp. NPDC050855]|uniref:hypothetical protein n=1 Tax=Streptosporangium sp. NPDC050855 TaxID=3366194 RepID=UPI00379ACC08
MLIYEDLCVGLPVVAEGKEYRINAYDADGITLGSVLPISSGESRYAFWYIPRDQVFDVITYDGDADYHESGGVLCDDCGKRVRPRSLESLPEHGCTERQHARREAAA